NDVGLATVGGGQELGRAVVDLGSQRVQLVGLDLSAAGVDGPARAGVHRVGGQVGPVGVGEGVAQERRTAGDGPAHGDGASAGGGAGGWDAATNRDLTGHKLLGALC